MLTSKKYDHFLPTRGTNSKTNWEKIVVLSIKEKIFLEWSEISLNFFFLDWLTTYCNEGFNSLYTSLYLKVLMFLSPNTGYKAATPEVWL